MRQGGTETAPGRLFVTSGDASARALVGKTEITPKTWHHLALVRDRRRVAIYLDGKTPPEIYGEVAVDPKQKLKSLLIGGAENGSASFEGKLDEVSLFDRALSVAEISGHFRASRDNSESLRPNCDWCV